ncbi:endolysin [Achromobacter phage 83-24]|uniref:Peptidase M15 n=1 Tax=Achromobacter phage 83-24 TaxID=1589747 RepID=A0A0B5A6U7_9CAUD|nr:endolysin [Achromobacter phage 83-24]AJD82866.1 peptidase M15 [Achromobacter phage 83-24]
MNLTPHFTLEELIHSDTAVARGIKNIPTEAEQANLLRLAQTLEEVRNVLGGKPIIISSGYRGEALNKAVGGVPDSAHRLGLAADFICPLFGSPYEICKAIQASGVKFDQLIYEIGPRSPWVHLGLRAGGSLPRMEVLTWKSGLGYRAGLQKL